MDGQLLDVQGRYSVNNAVSAISLTMLFWMRLLDFILK